jgi:hypothetical protein
MTFMHVVTKNNTISINTLGIFSSSCNGSPLLLFEQDSVHNPHGIGQEDKNMKTMINRTEMKKVVSFSSLSSLSSLPRHFIL